jgi:hypothetical protein
VHYGQEETIAKAARQAEITAPLRAPQFDGIWPIYVGLRVTAKSHLQVDVYLLFIRIRDGIKSLEITISESVD